MYGNSLLAKVKFPYPLKPFVRTSSRAKDLTGQRFSRLIAIAPGPTISHKGTWFCCCDCGKLALVNSSNLTRGIIKSCGCLLKEHIAAKFTTHGHSSGRTYSIYKNMRSRCHNPKATSYRWYGALGVKVCERWSSFENFLADMGKAPRGLQLDRIDPCGNYEPSNCRWATPKEQANNKRAK